MTEPEVELALIPSYCSISQKVWERQRKNYCKLLYYDVECKRFSYFHVQKSKQTNQPTTMLKNLTTLFSNSIAGSTNSNLAKQAQIFLVFSDCKIGFHLDLFIFGTKTTTWTVKNKAVCLCGICLTWLKETRYKGTCSLNSFCSLRSSQKFGRNAYSGFFVNYVNKVLTWSVSMESLAHVCVCACTHVQVCISLTYLLLYPLFLPPRSLLSDLG